MKFLSGLFFGKMLSKRKKQSDMNELEFIMALCWLLFWVYVVSVFLLPLMEVFNRLLDGAQ